MIKGNCIVTSHKDGTFTWEFDPKDTEVVEVQREVLELLLQAADSGGPLGMFGYGPA